MASVSISGVSQKSLINNSLNGFWSHVVWVGVFRRGIRSSSCHRCNDSSKSQEIKRELSSAALAVLTTRHACHPSLMSCLLSLEESLPSVPYVYGQSLEALLSQSAASESESRVHTPTHGGSEAHNELPNSTLPNEPKPLGKHRPPSPQSVLSPDELSYPL
ncbi:hypothetical protein Tco_0155922 [Tanacetum coccineum]